MQCFFPLRFCFWTACFWINVLNSKVKWSAYIEHAMNDTIVKSYSLYRVMLWKGLGLSYPLLNTLPNTKEICNVNVNFYSWNSTFVHFVDNIEKFLTNTYLKKLDCCVILVTAYIWTYIHITVLLDITISNKKAIV